MRLWQDVISLEAVEMVLTMIRNPEKWEAWRRREISSTPVDYEHNFRLVDAMWREAYDLGKFPSPSWREDLEVKIRLARILNVPGPTRKDR